MLFFFFIFNLLQDCVRSSRRLLLRLSAQESGQEKKNAQHKMTLALSLALINCWRLTKESAAFQVTELTAHVIPRHLVKKMRNMMNFQLHQKTDFAVGKFIFDGGN